MLRSTRRWTPTSPCVTDGNRSDRPLRSQRRRRPGEPARCRDARAGVLDASPSARCRTTRSARVQRTRRFQGFSPLTNPLRSPAVSSWRSPAPPMGFVPLRGPEASAGDSPLDETPTVRRRTVARPMPARTSAVAIHGGADRACSSRGSPAARRGTGSARLIATRSRRFPPGRLFSAQRGRPCAARCASRRSGDDHRGSASEVLVE